jgi:hypothetical protein
LIIHDRLGVILLALAGVGAALALLSMWRLQLMPSLRVYLRLMAGAAALQVLLGLVLVAAGHRPQVLHWVYGAATLAALPLAMLIGRGLGDREEHLWVVGGAVATVLLAFRAVATG